MKTILLSLAVLVTFSLTAQKNDKYTEVMYLNIQKIDSVKINSQKLELSNTFERIAKAEKNKWQPYYYAALLQILSTYDIDRKDIAKVDVVLDKADELLLDAELISPDNSELLCLKSMALSARISVDFQTRGATYGKQSYEVLQEAKKINPNNPRVYLLMAQNTFYTPHFMGGGRDKAKPMVEKSLESFKSFKPETKLDPSWGESMAKSLLEKCN